MRRIERLGLGRLGTAILFAWGLLAALAFAQPNDPATRHYAAAAALQNRGAYDLAADEWQKFIASYPSDERIGRAQHYLGVCLYQQGKYAEALGALQKALAASAPPELRQASQLYLGATQFALGQSGQREMYDRAAATLQGFLTQHPKSELLPEALYYLGECLYAQGKRQDAIRTFSRLLEQYPNHKSAAEALYALGVAQEESGDHPAAAGRFEGFLRRFPKHRLAPEVTLRLAEALLAQGRTGEAAKRFAEASAQPDFPLADYATLRHADVLAQQKQYVQAAALYERMASEHPKSQHVGRARLSAGRCLVLAGQYAEARKPLSAVLASSGPLAAEAAHWLAQAALKQRQPEEALKVAETALARLGEGSAACLLRWDRAEALYELPARRTDSIAAYAELAARYPKDPAAPQALYMAALVALESGDYATALAQTRQFLATYAQDALAADVLQIAAESRLQLGQRAEAEAAYRQLIDTYPNHPEAPTWRVRRVVAMYAQGRFAEALRAAEQLLPQLGSPQHVAEVHYVIGSSQLELKQFKQAIESLRASLAADPKWRQADETLLALAEAYHRAGDRAAAIAAVRRVLSEYAPSRVADRAHFRLGTYLALAGDSAAAAEQYRYVIEHYPQSTLVPNALHELGCIQLLRKDPAKAEAVFGMLLERYSQHELALRARYGRAMARHKQAKYSDAVTDVEAVLAAGPSAPDRSDAWFLLGLCQMELKQYERAAATLESLLKEDPKYPATDQVLYQLAWAWKLLGRDEEARKAFARLVREHPQSPLVSEAQFLVGDLYFQKADYALAAKAYQAALEKTDQTPLGEKVLYKLAWCSYHQGRFAEAEKTFASLMHKYPNGTLAADAAFMQAECLFRQDRFAEALGAYRKLGPSAGKDSPGLALLHAGQAAAQVKQFSESEKLLMRLVREFPDSPHLPEAFYELGWVRQNLQRLDEAVAAYEQVIARTDREVAARAQFMIGEIQFQQKNHKEAIKSFFRVVYGYSAPKWQADAAYEAARCFEVLGQKTQAITMYKELIDKFPQSDRAGLAKQRLTELTQGS